MAGDGLVRPWYSAPAADLRPGVQPGATSPVVVATTVIVAGTKPGIFVYNGVPGLGNIPIDWMSNSVTDPYGNTLPSPGGIGSFDGTSNWSQLANGLVLLGSSAVAVPARLELNTGTGTHSLAALSPRVLAGDTPCEFDLIPGAAAGQQTGAIDRLAAWAPGAAGATVETWHNVTPPTIGGSAATGTLRYKLRPTNEVTVECNLSFTALAAQTSVNLFTIPAAYFPTHGINWPMRTFTATAPVNNEMTGGVTSAGVVFANNIPVGANTIAFYQNYPLD